MKRLGKGWPFAAFIVATVLTIILAACRVQTVSAASPPDAAVFLPQMAECPAGEMCFALSWLPPKDSVGGAPDAYIVTSMTSQNTDAVTTDTVTTRPYVIRVKCSPGEAGTIAARVWSMRRGLKSTSAATAAQAYQCPDVPPPAPDSITIVPDSSPPVVVLDPPIDVPPVLGSLFAEPRDTSPHFDFARYTFTDFCYCWSDPSERAKAAKRYDLTMSGDMREWKRLNPTITALRYSLMQTVFTEEPDTNGKTDPDGITGKWQYDARAWFAAHPEYNYESMWLHDTTSGTPADSAHRLRRLIWKNYRYAINPLDAGARAYTIDRQRRILAEIEGAGGLFLDEMDASALNWIVYSREGKGVPTQVWQDSVVSLVSAIRKAIAPAMLQTNAAAYSTRPFDRRVGVAAGAMHLEQMNKATQEMLINWAFVDGLVADSTYVDLVNLETFGDFVRYGKGTSYPPGNYDDAVGRGETFQLASYYMVVDSLARWVGLHDNGQRNPVTPDSTDLAIYYLDVGHPKAKRYIWAQTTDALKQAATTYRRDFDKAVVLVRPVTSYKYPTLTDTTAVAVPLPEGGPWSMVKARGQTVPLDSLKLRNSEAVILVRRQ